MPTAMTFEQILKSKEDPTGCGVIVVRDGKVLAGTRIERAGKGKLCGPGGHIEDGETPEEAAKREAHEEFGITCNELTPLGVQTGEGRFGRSAIFVCSDFSGEPKTDEKEMTEPQWISPEEITEENAYPPFFQSMELLPNMAKSFEDILKFNHVHYPAGSPKGGQFAPKEGGSGGTDLSAYGKMIRTAPPPSKTITAYKAFIVKDGKLYPPMVANPNAMDTPVGVWLDAQEGTSAPPSKTGRPQVKAGGKGTKGGSGSLAYRPGWHLGEVPMATQFFTRNKTTGEKEMYENLVFAECQIAADHNYQKEAMSYGYTENGKFRHSYAGLPKIPTDGYYKYRTNPDPTTLPWYITGSMKVGKILTDAEANKLVRDAGYEPMKRKGGELTQEKLDALMTPKVKKSDDNVNDFTIFKADEDKHLVFGWASIAITVDGETLEDRQHDIIDPEDLEEAAYEYVLNFRDTGEEHLPGYRKKGKLVESCVFTEEKQKAIGIPPGILPVGWWIGFKIDDDDTWRRVKDGTYRMFSIEGKAERQPVEKSSMSFDEVLKYNHNHGPDGKFAEADGSSGGSVKEKQFAAIQNANPMRDDYHTGIRSPSDILNAKEAFNEDEFGGTPDWTMKDAQNALSTGSVTIYSSHPIETGTFVTPSKMEAKSYAGGGKIYSQTSPVDDVAWIDDIQGQYAPVAKTFNKILKFNHNHDPANGQFTSSPGGASGASGASVPSSSGSATNAEWQTGHKEEPYVDMVDARSGKISEEAVNKTAGDLGVSEDDARRYLNAITSYTCHNYTGIRRASDGLSGYEYLVDKANAIEEFIDKSPKWGGGELYRGLDVSYSDLSEMVSRAQKKEPIDMMGISSWTSDYDTAEYFALEMGNNPVILHTNGSKTNAGTSISHLSGYGEDEVLVSKKAVFTPTGIEKDDDDVVHIYGDLTK